MFRLNDFFCGCGGMGLGFKQAGFTTVGAWDFDKYAVQSYKENVDSIVEQADITKMTWEDVPQAEVWSFGFPCQDLSYAGHMKGLFEGKRSGLFFEVMRLLDETKENAPERLPVFLLAENVKGLKPYLGVLESEYEKRGYTMQVNMFNSKYWEVPQNRERYFIIGTRKDLDVSFSYPTEQHEYVPKLSSVLDLKVEEKYYLSEEKAEKIIKQALKKLDSLGHVHATSTPDRAVKQQNGRRAKGDEEPMFTLTCQDLHGVIVDDMYANREPRVYEESSPTLRSERNGLKVIEGQPKIQNVANCNPSGRGMNGSVYGVEGIAPTLTTNKGEGIKVLVSESVEFTGLKVTEQCTKVTDTTDVTHCLLSRDYKGPGNQPTTVIMEHRIIEPQADSPQRLAGLFDDEKGKHQAGSLWSKNGISPTLDTAQGGWRQPLVLEHYRVRKLTPTEYGRLQGFPMDTWNQVVSNTQAYKQFGNAVTVNVATAIATQIKLSLVHLRGAE